MQQRKGRGKFRSKREPSEFDQQIIDLARVTRVTKGGKQLSFRACVLIGDRKGRIGFGIEKGKDVQLAVEKAVRQAKKNLIRVPLINGTIPHRVEVKFKAAKVMMKPAPKGSGIIAGSSVRSALEMAGVSDASAKILGKTNNKVVNLMAAHMALQQFHPNAVQKSSAERAKAHPKKNEEAMKKPAKKRAPAAAAKPKTKKPKAAAASDSQ